MNLINILIILAIIYLAILIFNKLFPFIIGFLLALMIWIIVPYIFKGIVWFFSGFMNIMSMPLYWMTGYKVILPWWVGLIFFVTAFIPFLISGWRFQRESPTF